MGGVVKRRLTDNLRRVSDHIAAAAERSERRPEDVQLVAVTKSVEMDVIRQLLELGVADLGESRVQVLVKRAGMLDEQWQRRLARTSQESPDQPARPRWHMVGHLQRNKVRVALPWIELIHSLDSLRLAEEISAQAVKADREVRALMQINPTAEKTKFGVAVGAAMHLAEQIVSLPNLTLIGLMAMAYMSKTWMTTASMSSERLSSSVAPTAIHGTRPLSGGESTISAGMVCLAARPVARSGGRAICLCRTCGRSRSPWPQ